MKDRKPDQAGQSGHSGPDPQPPAEPPNSPPRRWHATDAHLIVDRLIVDAVARGEFDDLPGYGKPLQRLGEVHDPQWWVKKLVEREQITLLPPGLQLRRDDALLDEQLDAETSEAAVRKRVEEFNQRILAARYVALDGPPVITMPRGVETEVARWRERRTRRVAELTAAREQQAEPPPRRPSVWRRLWGLWS